MSFRSKTVWLVPPRLGRWLYPTRIVFCAGFTETHHAEPFDPDRPDAPPRLLRLKFFDLRRANNYLYVRNPGDGQWRGWRLWWYFRGPRAGHVDFLIDLRPQMLGVIG